MKKLMMALALLLALSANAFSQSAVLTYAQNADVKVTFTLPFSSSNTTQSFSIANRGLFSHSVTATPRGTAANVTVTVSASIDGGVTYTTVGTSTSFGAIVFNGNYSDIKITFSGTGLTISAPPVDAVYIGNNAIAASAPLGVTTLTAVGTSTLGSTVYAASTVAADFYGMTAYNGHSAPCYVQFFDVASGSVTLGTTVPAFYLPLPAVGGSNIFSSVSLSRFGTAMSLASTTTPTGSTTCTTGTVITLFKK